MPSGGGEIQAGRGATVPGGLGRAAGSGSGPLRAQDGHRAVRAAGEARDGTPRLRHAVGARRRAPSGVLGGGQRLVAPGRGLREEDERGVPQRYPGPLAGECQLAQPGGGVLLDAPEEGTEAQRLSGFARAGAADQALRGVDQPGSAAVRLDVHQVRPVRPACMFNSLPSSRREYPRQGSREEVFRSAEVRPLAAD